MTIKIGTRGSKLALWQAYFIQDLLRAKGAETEIIIIETKGDKILDRALSKIGSKGVFTEELEDQLRTGAIDIAVHSAKDLQSELDEDFKIIAFTEREKVNDVLVSFNKNLSLNSGESFVVGTSSTRRVAMLKAYYPHIKVVDMRGNLQTRLRKLEENHCDALLLAFAGVHRMEQDNLIIDFLKLEEFTPAVGQGSIAIEASQRLDYQRVTLIREACNHRETELCLLAERAFLKKLQGGCSIPVFGNCTPSPLLNPPPVGEGLIMVGGIISLDGQKIIRETLVDSFENAEKLGEKLAEKVLSLGGAEILQEIKSQL